MIGRTRAWLERHRTASVAALLLAAVVWLGFFDSHSLYKRISWYREAERLRIENAALEAEIARLEVELGQELSDEEIERIAREQYGMQREGETVYPVRTRE